MRYQRIHKPWSPYLMVGVMVFLLLLAGHQYDEEVLAASAQVVAGRVVVIDPGHGKPDPGSSGASGIMEKDIVLAISLKLHDMLVSRGVVVHMTRVGDYDLADADTQGLAQRKREDLARRVEMVNEINPDLFISVHANAFPSSRWSGAQTFYRKGCENSQQLALAMQNQLRRITANTQRQASSQVDLIVLRGTTVPAVVVEVGFLSNPREEALLRQDEYQARLAWAIYTGMVQYLREMSLPTDY